MVIRNNSTKNDKSEKELRENPSALMNTEDGLKVAQKVLITSFAEIFAKSVPKPLHPLAQPERKAAMWGKTGYNY